MQSGTFDLVVIAQTIHHFSPGQLAMMMAQSRRVASESFIGIDGQRSLLLLNTLHWAATSQAVLFANYKLWHDAVVSGRKFYPKSELELIARIAAPGAGIGVKWLFPIYSVIEVSG